MRTIEEVNEEYKNLCMQAFNQFYAAIAKAMELNHEGAEIKKQEEVKNVEGN